MEKWIRVQCWNIVLKDGGGRGGRGEEARTQDENRENQKRKVWEEKWGENRMASKTA